MRLVDVEINNFRTFQNFKLEGLNSLQVITGANNSGKTNFLRALDLFFNERIEGKRYERTVDLPNQISHGTRSGSAKSSILITLCFSKDEIKNLFQKRHSKFRKTYLIKKNKEYCLKIKKTFKKVGLLQDIGRYIFNNNTQVKVKRNSEEDKSLRIIFERIRYYFLPSDFDANDLIKDELIAEVLSLSLDVFGKSQEHKTNVKNTRDTFKNFIEETNTLLKENSKELTNYLQDLLVQTPRLTGNVPIKNWEIKIELPEQAKIIEAIQNITVFRLEDGTKGTLIESKGSGLQKTTAILFMEYIFKSIKESGRSTKPLIIWGIDEPELNLQPSLQKTIYSRLKELSNQQQIMLVTHSPYFVDIFDSIGNISLFDLSAQFEEIRGNMFCVKETKVFNSETKTADFLKMIRDHLGISVFDGWTILKTNYLLEGNSDELYLRSMYKNLLEKYLGGSILPTWGVDSAPAYIRHIDNMVKNEPTKVKAILLFDFDDAGKRVKKKINKKDYKKLELRSVFTDSRYFDDLSDRDQSEIEDMVLPEVYWNAIISFLVEEKNIAKDKIPNFDVFYQKRKSFKNFKMTEFLNTWLVAELNGTLEKDLMTKESVKFAIAARFSKALDVLTSDEKTGYRNKYPRLIEFLKNFQA